MGRVITVTSGKGGVGKSTTSASLSMGLAKRGYRTLVIDFDIGLRNLDLLLGHEKRVLFDIVNVMNGEVPLEQAVIRDHRCDSLYQLPGSQTETKDVLKLKKIAQMIDQARHKFDYIICDSPAGIEHGARMAMYFADDAVLVATPFELTSLATAAIGDALEGHHYHDAAHWLTAALRAALPLTSARDGEGLELTAEERGFLFIGPGIEVYQGMVVGEHQRPGDLDINVCKTKQLTNMRSAGAEELDTLQAPIQMTLERALEYIQAYQVTHSQWVPTMFVRMLKLPPEERARYDVSSLQVAIHAAAPCPIPVKEQMIEWWGPILTEYYGGTELNGLTFIVMELVEGLPITQYADEHRLSLPQRLRLFTEVCQAVQHAHQRGIIHRERLHDRDRGG
mgnify:CR=1 FL=1